MKIIKIENGIFSKFEKTSAFKVRYRERFGPMTEKEKILNLDNAQDAIRYIKTVVGRDVDILDIQEVEKKEPIPMDVDKKPTRQKTVRKSPGVKTTKAPKYDFPDSGYRITYYEDMSDPKTHNKVYDAETRQEAISQFKQEFPKGIIVGNPINLSVKSSPMTYDEEGKPVNQDKKDWLTERSYENLSYDEMRRKMKDRI